MNKIEETEKWLKIAPDGIYADFSSINSRKLEKKNGKWFSIKLGTKSLQGYAIVPDKITKLDLREAALQYLTMADCVHKWINNGTFIVDKENNNANK